MTMTTIYLALVLCLASVAFAAPDAHWLAYKTKHQKTYDNAAEDSMRRHIFAANKARVEQFNANEAHEAGYRMALNHFSDLTEEERQRMNGLILPEDDEEMKAATNNPEGQQFLERLLAGDDPVPEALDWRKVPGRVSEVKDQGRDCGSCWAFSTTGVLEGQEHGTNLTRGLENGELVELSEQDLVDCSRQNKGCHGGLVLYALQDISDLGGIEDESNYPYHASQGECRFKRRKSVLAARDGFVMPGTDEERLKRALARYGPISIGIHATDKLFDYKAGIFRDSACNPKELNHAVLLVGYDSDPEFGKYWIVKNSWSKHWGDSGYFKLPREQGNYCGVASYAVLALF